MSQTADVSALRAELESAASGLLYGSEGDYPFDFVAYPGATAADLAPERIGAVLGKPGEIAEEVPLERFFRHHVDGDPNDPVGVAASGRYRALRDLLAQRLPDLRVFRLGRVQVECYLLGSVPGGLAGLHTTAIET
ncbi:MAG TPA: nuclease A inhibitor family protein [Longimicrobium sp.]|jgi:hypothetical protein|uniref:nuclease A inhibitor family protein n=1 Tax=Longimicrobium sp. TaxID=2029185 RepID=UPI002EDAF877